MNELTRLQICDLYAAQKIPIKQIARTVGYAPKTVRDVLRAEGAYIPQPARAAAYCVIDYRRCAVCPALFIGRPSDGGHRKTCSAPCAAEHRRRIGNARKRNREHIERAAFSDITPGQELEMRRKARKCPLCGVRLTDKPGLPNSKHLDHIIPICVGGTHTHGNCRITCRSCNVRRPKDGSDYTGPVTLWAVLPGTVTRPHGGTNKTTCRKGLHPWVTENIGTASTGKKYCRACRGVIGRARNPLRPCTRCGTPAALHGGQAMCPDCTEAMARQAAELHASGTLSWNEIAPLVGYGSGWGAAYAAKRIGYVPAPRPTADKRPKCPACRQVATVRGRECQACAEAKAWSAVEMRRGGMTLLEIAGRLGFTSKSSVTNLMKTVVPMESKMGRPRKHA